MRFTTVYFALFALLACASLAVAQNTPTPEQVRAYRIWPGDEVTGKVSGESDYDFVATVAEDGTIYVPFDDKAIVAKCKTEDQVKRELMTLLGRHLKRPMFSFRVTDRRSRPPATVSGEVALPSQIILYRKVSLLEILSAAGGIKEEAGGTVQIFRTQASPCADESELIAWKPSPTDPTGVPSRIFSVAAVKVGGGEDSNPSIYPGDVIVVQKATPVYIMGEVNAPQGIYIKDGGLTLVEAIAKIGGPRREAKTKDIKIYRLKPGGKEREIISANYDLIRKGKQKDILLEPYDIVEVDQAKDSIAKTILKMAIGAGQNVVTSAGANAGTRIIY